MNMQSHEIDLPAELYSLNQSSEDLINVCCAALLEYRSDIEAVVLTGSFSRGEETIVRLNSLERIVLGDIEFIVITKEGINPFDLLSKMKSAEQKAEVMLKQQGVTCSVEFSAVAHNFLKRLRPMIFSYELLMHGKVVYGDADLLEKVTGIHANDIPKSDAFYLLCNRIVEQLIHLKKLSKGECSGLEAYYPLVKMYMDMAGSFLTITGKYEPSYALRLERFLDMPEAERFVRGEEYSRFISILESMTNFKLQRNDNFNDKQHTSDHIMSLFRETIPFAFKLWIWEVKFMTGKDAETISNSCKAILTKQTIKIKLRGWLKYLRTAWVMNEEISVLKFLRLFCLGTPQMLIYCAAAHLYFGAEDKKRSDVYAAMYIIPKKINLTSWNEAVDAVIEAWNKFVRSA
ncbi:MAG: hypothetical protein JXR79_04210 [Nitrospirae bacterium]|nr:hypothetical protein [Nitrospirota bacterium]